jgi:hypothetical protein
MPFPHEVNYLFSCFQQQFKIYRHSLVSGFIVSRIDNLRSFLQLRSLVLDMLIRKVFIAVVVKGRPKIFKIRFSLVIVD